MNSVDFALISYYSSVHTNESFLFILFQINSGNLKYNLWSERLMRNSLSDCFVASIIQNIMNKDLTYLNTHVFTCAFNISVLNDFVKIYNIYL